MTRLRMTVVCFAAVLVAASLAFAEPAVNYTSGRKKPAAQSAVAVRGEPEPAVPPEPPSEAEQAPAATEVPSSIHVSAPALPPEVPPSSVLSASATAESAPAAPPPATVPAPPPETVLLEDALPEGATPEGNWIWDLENAAGGARSHGHPAEPGLQSHALLFSQPVVLTSRDMITQQVWLDPQNPPRAIALHFRRGSGEEVGLYWEGEEEVFTPTEYEELWYYGALPELGRWERLEILAEDLGLEAEEPIVGIRFVTHGGRVLWDRTALTPAPDMEGTEQPTAGPMELRPDLAG